jgi:GT2 family glycosyltransferase
MTDGEKDARANPPAGASVNPLVSIVILSYNSRGFIGPCLRSVAALEWAPIEVVIPDNASSDDSPRIAREAAEAERMDVSVIPLPENLGCAGGNNAGWRATRGRFVVFLNPDTEVTPAFVTELVRPMLADPAIAVTGAKIFYPGGRTLQHAGAFMYPNGMTDHYGAGCEDTGEFDTPRDVDYVTGAGFAIRRAALEQAGGFDEDYYPAYFEESDLCTRIRRAGWRVVYIPTAVLVHHESVSLTANSPGFHRMYQRMRIRFCLKNLSLKDWLTRFIPFEAWWLLREPIAKGHRLEQFRAYAEGAQWWVRKKLGRTGRF